jgi:hypothetical protein
MIHQWGNLKMLKRVGRGHDPAGVNGTQEGKCTVRCCTCPQPGKNLPPEWRDAPEEIQYVSNSTILLHALMYEHRWLYATLVGNDTNFRMVHMKMSGEVADLTLSPSWAIFCEVIKYYTHLAKHGNQVPEVSGRPPRTIERA